MSGELPDGDESRISASEVNADVNGSDAEQRAVQLTNLGQLAEDDLCPVTSELADVPVDQMDTGETVVSEIVSESSDEEWTESSVKRNRKQRASDVYAPVSHVRLFGIPVVSVPSRGSIKLHRFATAFIAVAAAFIGAHVIAVGMHKS